MLFSLPPVSSLLGVVRYANWSSQSWLQMVLELNSSHTSSQANEPLLCPLFNMDVTPAGYSLTHCENYFSIKMQELELCPERAAKNTALWVLVTGNLVATFLSPSVPQASLLPARSLLEALNTVSSLSLNLPC